MARIEHDGRTTILFEAHQLGRGHAADTCIEDPRVSVAHACIRWNGGAWELLDLGSRNGCFVDGVLAGPGAPVVLREGSRLQLCAWQAVLTDLSPPGVWAQSESGVERRAAGEALLWDGAIAVHRGSDGGWLLDRNGEIEPIADRASVEAEAESWTVYLPKGVARTVDAAPSAPSIFDLALRFQVSADEEYVALTATHDAGVIDLGSRAHNYLLLTLARLRLEDTTGGADAASAGWTDVESLQRMLRCAEGKINIEIHRARRLLADADVRDAAMIVERRRYTRKLRLGVADLGVEVV